MKKAWFFLIFIPIPFIANYFDYTVRNIYNVNIPIFFILFFIGILMVGYFSKNIPFYLIVLMNIINAIFSIALTYCFIPNNDYYFTPLDRTYTVLLTSIFYFLGQLVIKLFTNFFKK